MIDSQSFYEIIRTRIAIFRFAIFVGRRTYNEVMKAMEDHGENGTKLVINTGNKTLTIHNGKTEITDNTHSEGLK